MNIIGKTVADIVDLVATGKIGHADAMDALGLDNFPDLVETIHANGRTMWAHKARPPSAATVSVLAMACGLSQDDASSARATTTRPSASREL